MNSMPMAMTVTASVPADGFWGPYTDTPATKTEELDVRTRTVYRYCKKNG